MPPTAHTQYPAQYHNNGPRRIEHHNQHVSFSFVGIIFFLEDNVFFCID